MPLCDVCGRFDIRALISAAAKRLDTPDSFDDSIEFSEHLPFYSHYESVHAIGAKAQRFGCDLCALIWQGWAEQNGLKQSYDFYDRCDRHKSRRKGNSSRLGVEELTKFRQSRHKSVRLYVLRLKELFYSSGPAVRLFARFGVRGLFPRECVQYHISISSEGLGTESDNDELGKLLLDPVYEKPDSPVCLAKAKTWLASCLSNDDSNQCGCRRENEGGSLLPSRVIRVGDTDHEPSLYVSAKGETGQWISLSYCWGGESAFKLTQDTFSIATRGLTLESFPQTIRDAIYITRALGIPFLWIDALCIIQDSLGDWEEEAPKMAEIYSNSVLTIIAAAAPSVSSGIFQQRHPPPCTLAWSIPKKSPSSADELDLKGLRILPRKNRMGVCLRLRGKGPPREEVPNPKNSTWATRGWTLQEYLLSYRTLTYTQNQMLWRCPNMACWENGQSAQREAMMEDDLPSMHKYALDTSKTRQQTDSISPTNTNEFYMDWYTMVGDFTKRHLSKRSDELAAIGGIAKRMQTHTSTEYCAGLWMDDLIFGLLWKYADDARPLEDAVLCLEQPSWHWMSLNAPVWWCFWLPRWDETYGFTYKEIAQVEDVCIAFSSKSLYGSIDRGEIVLTGPCYFTDRISPWGRKLWDKKLQGFDQIISDSLRDSQEFKKRHRSYNGQTFAIIQVAQIKCSLYLGEDVPRTEVAVLVLESVERPIGPEVMYRRVGLIILADPVGREAIPAWGPHGYPESSKTPVLEKQENRAKEHFTWPQRTIRVI